MFSDIGISSVICLIVSYIQGTEPLRVQSEFNQTGALKISWKDQQNILPKATEFVWVRSSTRVLWPWGEVRDASVVVKDALRHDTLQLQIMRQYKNLSYTEFQVDVKVQKQFLSEGESGTITWNTQENLIDGGYFIFHDNHQILEIGRESANGNNTGKYVYNRDPNVSGLVRFQIKGVTPRDFGTYRGGSTRGSSREGTFVLVYGQPKKPTIIGQSKVSVGDHVTLSCSSTSTSEPAAFQGFPIMTYEWFENGTSISLGKVLRLKVENSSYEKIITCQAKEELLSKLSDPVQIEKPHCMTNITTSFVEGSARFLWSVPEASLGEMSTEVLVTRDKDPGDWTLVGNKSYTVRDCLTFSTIEIDVRFLSNQKEIALCRGLFTKLNKPDAFIKQKGRDATLNWTIPFFPSSKLYSIFKHSGSDKMDRQIITVEDNKVTPIDMEKYNYTSNPLNSTLIVFNVNSVTSRDAGVYAGGISSFDAARKKGVLLVVADKPTIPTINHTSVPRYGEAVTLTCNSSSTTYPEYFRPLLTWSFTWYRNGSAVHDNATYTLTVRRDNMYDDITCRVREVLYSANSTSYKINMNILKNLFEWGSTQVEEYDEGFKYLMHDESKPAEPKITRISSNTSPGVLLVTWEPDYNGGSSQHFLVYLLNLTVWNLVANTTHSDATIEYGIEAPSPEEAVAVMACNTHGCSRPAKLIRASDSLTGSVGSSVGIIIGGSLSVVVVALLIGASLLQMKYGSVF